MRSHNDRMIAFFMLLPSIILLGIFVYGFIGLSVQTSLTDWGNNQQEKPPLQEGVERSYIGLENYQRLLTAVREFRFRNSMVNTFFFTVLFIGGCVAVGFGLATLIDQKIRFEGFFRTTFLLPMSLSFVVTGTVWRWMLQPNGGVNILPEKIFGLGRIKQSWVNSETLLWKFDWQDIPLFLTYIGLATLGFLAFNYLSQENDRVGVISKVIIHLFVVWLLALIVLSLLFGGASLNWLWAALIALASLAYRYYQSDGHVLDMQDKAERSWRPVQYFAIAAVIVAGVYIAGLWDKIFLPLATPAAEQPKGYNAALSGVILAAIWQMSGYTMAMFLAGIRGIPEELREAARVDGASELEVYTSIIIPLLRPITLSAMIILGHISLKIFDLVFAMAGPDNGNTMVPGILVYTAFRSNRFAIASAVAVIMLVLVALVIIPYLYTSLREEKK
ncbi:MAG: sugar ABC transporter permease [Anaerolineae bacterium]|nr:sugar ABC transporter permease [Anaerolineae bacterium]